MGWPERKALMQGTAVRTYPEEVTYQASATDNPVPLTGIWSDAHIQIDPDTQATVSSTNPILDVILNDLPGQTPTEGARIIRLLFPTVVYKLLEHQPDGQGMTRFELQLGRPF